MRTGWVIVIAISTLLVGLLIGGIGGAVIGFGAGAGVGAAGGLQNLGQAPENVTTLVQAPASAKSGSNFTVTVTISNTGDKPARIDTIDVSGDYLGNSQIISVVPKPLKVDPALGTHEHTFDQTIAAGGSSVFTFTIKAGAAGTYTGDWDAWFEGYAVETSAETIEITP